MRIFRPRPRPLADAQVAGAESIVIAPLAEGDRPAVWDLYRQVAHFPPAESVAAYWRWRFEHHPESDGAPPTFWVAKHAGRVVGGMAQMPAILVVSGQAVATQWAADFMVHPEHRGRGVGKRIFDHYRHANAMTLSMGYAPDSVTSSVARAVGFRVLPPLPYLFKFYSLRPLLARLGHLGRSGAALTAFSRAVLRPRRRSWAEAVSAGVVLREIDRFGDEFDGLWSRVAPEINLGIRRTQQTMNWRYVDNPFVRYRAVGAWRDGALAGCFVLKVVDGARFRYGTIPEIIVPRDDEVVQRALLGRALAYFEATGTDVVKALFSPPHLSKLLRRAGFLPLGKGCDVVFAFQPHLAPLLKNAEGRGSAWYLTKGDGDCDIVPDFLTMT